MTWPASTALVSGANVATLPTTGFTSPYWSRWWVYTPTSTQSLTINTSGTEPTSDPGLDTILNVWTGADFLTRTLVASNDDGGLTGHFTLSQLTFTFAAGTTYYIQVGAFDYTTAITAYHLNAPFTGGNTSSDTGSDPTPGDWRVLDLSTAFFYGNGVSNWGQYDGGGIVTLIGYPDFIFPGFTFGVDTVYDFEVTYEASDNVGMWIYGEASESDASYNASPFHDFYGSDISGLAVYIFEVGPTLAQWDTNVTEGLMVPLFESDKFGRLIGLRYRIVSGAGGTPPTAEGSPPPVSNPDFFRTSGSMW